MYKICPNCHNSNEESQKFCIHCGFELHANEINHVSRRVNDLCPNCHNLVNRTQDICPNCGTRLKIHRSPLSRICGCCSFFILLIFIIICIYFFIALA